MTALEEQEVVNQIDRFVVAVDNALGRLTSIVKMLSERCERLTGASRQPGKGFAIAYPVARANTMNAPKYDLRAFAKDRAEMAEIARAKLRQARAHHIPYSPQTERVVELLADWSASFVPGAIS